MRRYQAPGNALIEYALPLAVFFLSGTLLMSVADVNSELGRFINDTLKGIQNGSQVRIAGYGILPVATAAPGTSVLPSGGGSGQGGLIAAPPEGTERVCFKSGLCLNVPVFSGQISTETSGAMGGNLTKKLADVLLQISKQMEASGADPSLVAKITALANKGHEIGDHEALREDGFRTNINLLMNDPGLTCEGASGSYTCTPKPGNMSTYHDPTALNWFRGNLDIQTAQFQAQLDELNALMDAYSGAVSPEARAIINYEAQYILLIANGYDASFLEACSAGQIFTLSLTNGSGEINTSANEICNQGGTDCIRDEGGGDSAGASDSGQGGSGTG